MPESERDHVSDLRQLRQEWVEQRRTYVQHLIADKPLGTKERALNYAAVVEMQARIEAVDRAITDEENLAATGLQEGGRLLDR